MQERIRLANGKAVLASIINYQFDVDGKRTGIATVVCSDRDVAGVDGNVYPLFLVWTAFPSDYSDDFWNCENGDYSLTWDQAVERMIERFQRNAFGRNQQLHRDLAEMGEPF